MTDIPTYNEKEISMKDISFCYKSDRRAQDVRGTSVLRRPFHGFRGILKSLCKCISYTRYIINDASVDKNQHNLGEIKG